MTRDEAIKSLYCRGDMTKEDIVNKIYDAHFAECKAKDERIAELGTMIEKMKCCENCEYYPPSKCGKSAQYGCLGDGYNDWRLKNV